MIVSSNLRGICNVLTSSSNLLCCFLLQTNLMDICEVIMERNRHDNDKSCSTTLQYHDLEAAEALVCMSSWIQRSPKPRPLTPTSDSCDSLSLHHEALESPKDLVSLSSLVSFKNVFALITHYTSVIHLHPEVKE